MRPTRCDLCGRQALDWGVPRGVHLKYCKKCQRYACTEYCWDVSYCLTCMAKKREAEPALS